MSDEHGKFIWAELMTTDPLAAGAFYRAVVGWTTVEMADYDYTVFEAARPDGEGRAGVAGMMRIPPELLAEHVPPNWTAYVSVSDCDATVARVAALGGTVRRPPEDIPAIGRFAVVADPHGAVLCIMTPLPMDTPPRSVPAMTPGQFGWYELHTDDVDAAFAFYSQVFGWSLDHDMDMGDFGVYRIFAHDGQAVGGMMKRMPQMSNAHWACYITVARLDDAVSRLVTGGGSVLNGPMEVPGPAYIVNAIDPQGAFISLLATER
ncbi:VOC family protein [Rhizobium sp. Leaf341]|uniref:VOC family protein n=1 Tax=Rhizobium sp. Leaf341 TaxID=1736344 RepID=UPI000712F0BB|nr:VOC family protein [Rhizobium sp. Leaf341]KQR69526.1 glyoxalase [Rhizobium sp. Leaf341]